MMKKLTAVLLAVSAMLASFSTVMADDAVTVIVNDKQVEFTEIAPFIESERTLVPFRAIFEALGAEVFWDEETRTVISYDPASEINVSLQIDSANMFVNGERVELDVPAKIVNNFTVVPLRAVSEGLKRKVDWNNDTRTVTIQNQVTE